MPITNISAKFNKTFATFKSPNNSKIQMENIRYYDKTPLNPTIETSRIFDGNNVYAEYNKKRLANGDIFESYILPDETVKVLKNRFYDIKAFKSTIEQHNVNPSKSYDNIKNAVQNYFHNFMR